MPLRTVAALLLFGSLSLGCRPILLHAPGELSAHRDNPSEEESDETANSSDGDETGSDENTAADTAAPPIALGSGEWILRVVPLGERPDRQSLRWRNIPLEEALAQPASDRPDFAQWMKYKSKSVAGNAAIAAARLIVEANHTASPSDEQLAPANEAPASSSQANEREVVAALSKTVRAGELKLPQRRAAIEALGRLPREAARQALFALTDQYGDFAGPNRNVYSSDLHVELLSALAQNSDEQTLARFVAAVPCRAVEVRLAVVEHWPASERSALTEELFELSHDPDPRVRSECLKLLARCQHEKALLLAQRALSDVKFDVRLAAVEAIGDIPGQESSEELARVCRHPTAALRAAAIKALAEREAWESALVAVDDTDGQVRLALAGELSRVSTQSAAQAAEKLLEDNSLAVQQKTVESIGQWPWPRSGKLLLTALDSRVYQTRETAAKVLAKHWGPAASFPYDGDSDSRVAALVELQEKWHTEFPDDQVSLAEEPKKEIAAEVSTSANVVNSAHKEQVAADLKILNNQRSSEAAKAAASTRLALLEAELPTALLALIHEQKSALPEEVYLQVLPEVDSEFELLARLAKADATGRRKAMSDLRQNATKEPLSELALLRIVDLVVAESDPIVWHEVQQMLEADLREPVVRLQYAGLNHPTAEVQRRACLYLGRHGEARHAEVLLAALADGNPQVVRAAAEALGHLQQLGNTLPLVRLLASRDRELVLIVASSLARQGEECGGDGLDRMALDVDPKLRRRAIEMMGELKQPRFVPSLIRALDDQLGIKQTALDALVATTGQDIGRGADETNPPMADQIYRWKQWYAKQEKAQLRTRR